MWNPVTEATNRSRLFSHLSVFSNIAWRWYFTHIDLHLHEQKQTMVRCVFHLHNTWISCQSGKHEVSMIKVLPQHFANLIFYQLC